MPPDGNYLITGGSVNFSSGDVIHQHGQSWIDQALDRLYAKTSPAAFHNSLERSNEVRQQSCCSSCPDVEEAYGELLQDIWEWIYTPITSRTIMWIHSPPGEETSRIAQTIADAMHLRGELSGSFFFSGISSASWRHDGTRLVPTLAYQLTQSISQTRSDIANTVFHDRSIFDLALSHQFRKLIVEPLALVSEFLQQEVTTAPKLFIIHALEACVIPSFQESLIEAFGNSLELMQHNLPQRILVLGCNTEHLKECFSKPRLREMVLERSLYSYSLPTSPPTSDSDDESFFDSFRLSENTKRTLLMFGAVAARNVVKGLFR